MAWDNTIEIEGGSMARCTKCDHLTPHWVEGEDESCFEGGLRVGRNSAANAKLRYAARRKAGLCI
jgi:hypothetical protein